MAEKKTKRKTEDVREKEVLLFSSSDAHGDVGTVTTVDTDQINDDIQVKSFFSVTDRKIRYFM
jgi:hypothetical protein